MILSALSSCCILSKTCSLNFFYFFQKFNIDSFRIINPAGRIRNGNNLCTKLLSFLCCVNSNVTSTGNNNCFTSQIMSVAFQHFLCIVQKTISGSFCTSERTTVSKSFTCQNTFIQVADSLILSEHITDFTSTNTDITGRNVCICSDMFAKFCHKALAECHNLTV